MSASCGQAIDVVPAETIAGPLHSPTTVASHSASAKPRTYRYDSLDLWRGVACLLVVFYHSTLNLYATNADHAQLRMSGFASVALNIMHYGNLGVPMFFVISGYCIAATAQSALERRTPLGTYFWRRFRRIYPPYWIMLGLLIVGFIVFDVLLFPGILSSDPRPRFRPWWFSGTQWLGNLTLTETWRHHLFGSQRAHVIG